MLSTNVETAFLTCHKVKPSSDLLWRAQWYEVFTHKLPEGSNFDGLIACQFKHPPRDQNVNAYA
ncbi:hypothetical protein G4B88_023483 [Cannabis sativa]|uniref:Uncharacterized protein n=1 Tax=Cannabis sativa TaxID=3483 RepID=A0A7J6HVR5_CANSA|nr:hypothetical protein G4B88_023483 [Cannabis sativa]